MANMDVLNLLTHKLNEAAPCDATNISKRYLIVLKDSSKGLFEAELSHEELYNIISEPHTKTMDDFYKGLWNRTPSSDPRDRNNATANTKCITNVAFCNERVGCLGEMQDRLTIALNTLNYKRVSNFYKILSSGQSDSIYLNANMSSMLFHFDAPYCHQFAKNVFMMFGQVLNDNLVDKHYFDVTVKAGKTVIDLIDWNTLPTTNNLTSPVFLCNYLGDCNLFSLFELYNKKFPEIANAIAEYRPEKNQSSLPELSFEEEYNQLHDRFKPKQCSSKNTCKPIYIYMNENGEIWIKKTSSVFSTNSSEDTTSYFLSELDLLYSNYKQKEEGFYIDILEYYRNKTCITAERFCPFSGIQHKTITTTLKSYISATINEIEDIVKNENSTTCPFESSVWDQLTATFMNNSDQSDNKSEPNQNSYAKPVAPIYNISKENPQVITTIKTVFWILLLFVVTVCGFVGGNYIWNYFKSRTLSANSISYFARNSQGSSSSYISFSRLSQTNLSPYG